MKWEIVEELHKYELTTQYNVLVEARGIYDRDAFTNMVLHSIRVTNSDLPTVSMMYDDLACVVSYRVTSAAPPSEFTYLGKRFIWLDLGVVS